MDLGTAKPTREERARLPHHLIDVADPDQPFTAGEYSRQARAALREIAARGRLPIVTGGTGLYLRALTEGLFAGPERQQELRVRLQQSRERHGEDWLHRLLRRLDPASAARIHSNDAAKLIRAIEVCLAARKPLSRMVNQEKPATRSPAFGCCASASTRRARRFTTGSTGAALKCLRRASSKRRAACSNATGR